MDEGRKQCYIPASLELKKLLGTSIYSLWNEGADLVTYVGKVGKMRYVKLQGWKIKCTEVLKDISKRQLCPLDTRRPGIQLQRGVLQGALSTSYKWRKQGLPAGEKELKPAEVEPTHWHTGFTETRGQKRTQRGSLYLFSYQGEHGRLVRFTEADAVQRALPSTGHGHRALLPQGFQQCLLGERAQVRRPLFSFLTPNILR